jgi:hypothetical protein
MEARITLRHWDESMQPRAAARTAVIASVCQCADSMKNWWIRFDPVPSLSEPDAVDMFNVNHDTRIGTVELMGQFGRFLPWRDYHFQFKELFKTGEDGHTPDEDWADAVKLAEAVARSNEIAELQNLVPTSGVRSDVTRRL